MNNPEQVSCAIVCMPFADVLQPPLGVSVLCGAMRDAGISVKAFYPSLSFAEKVPYRVYEWLGSNTYERVADYYFSRIAFGFDPDADRAFRSMIASLREKERLPSNLLDGVSDTLLALIRSACEEVVAETVEALCALKHLKVVACSATFLQLYASLAVLRQLKARRPNVVTIIGGAECEGAAADELARKLEFIDFACSGEGDKSLPELVLRCLNGGSSEKLPDGVADRKGVPECGVSCSMVEPAQFGRVDHSDYLSRFASSGLFSAFKPTMTIEFSRGCWKGERSHCTFCGFNGERMHFRHKPVSRILDEMVQMYERGVRFFQATDTILDIHTMRSVFEAFSERCPDAVITCDVSPVLSSEQLAFLAQNGVLFLQAGIETLHPHHVTLLNKASSPANSIAFLKYAREQGIAVFWNILTSIPGDDPEEYEQMSKMVPLLEHLSPPHFGVIRFDRFSSYWKTPGKYGLSLKPSSSCRYLLPARSKLDPCRVSMFFDNENESIRTDYRDKSIHGLSERIAEWQKCHHKAALYWDEDNTVVDTRTVAVFKRRKLSSEESVVLEFLRSPHTRTEIDAKFPTADTILKALISAHYVLQWDDRYLSLITQRERIVSEGRRRSIEYRLLLPSAVAERQRKENYGLVC